LTLLIALAFPGVALAAPPGRGYAPPSAPPPKAYDAPVPYAGDPPSPDAVARRLGILDAEVGELRLRREQYTFSFPVALTVVGVAVAAMGVAIISEWTCSTSMSTSDVGCDSTNASATGPLVFLGGAAAIAAGTTLLIVRGTKRRHLDQQIAKRERESSALRGLGVPRAGFVPARAGGLVTLALDF
jgi:hypothetical protein